MRQRALVAGARFPDTDPATLEDHLDELVRLLDTLGVTAEGMAVQRMGQPRAGTYFGPGFIRSEIDRFQPDLLVAEANLSPAQARNLEEIAGVPVMDRTQVILEIFDRHARTKEARVQVELAQLRYRRTGLRRTDDQLAQQVGAIGVRGGKGEKRIELDRRTLDKRIATLKRELRKIEKQRELTLKKRRESFSVALVGYTNAGKSTLLNRLTREQVRSGNRLFVTLDTTSRKWFLAPDDWTVLSDTVGFIRNLPHLLVASFRSTFGVADAASVLIHVADLTAADMQEQIDVVQQTLQEMELDDRPLLLVFNKSDAVEPRTVQRFLNLYPGSIAVSALSGSGLDELKTRISEWKSRFPAVRS